MMIFLLKSSGFFHMKRSRSNLSLSKLYMVHVELLSGHNLAIRDRSGTYTTDLYYTSATTRLFL